MAVPKTFLPIRVLLAMMLFQLTAAGCVWQDVGEKPSPTPIAAVIASPTTVPLPDLAIEEVGVQAVESSKARCDHPDELFVLRVVVSNRGSAAAGAFSLEINAEVQSVPDGLQPSEQISLSVPFHQGRTIIHLDTLDQVQEKAESNNTFSDEIAMPEIPPACRQTPTPAVIQYSALNVLEGHTGRVMAAAFSPDGRLIASGSVDNTMRLWTSDQGDPLRIMQGHTFPILCLGFSPNGARLATGSMDGVVRVWQVSNSSLLATMKGHAGWITSLDFSPDGQWLASASDDFTVRIWRLANNSQAQTIDEGMAAIQAVVFSPDSRSVAWAEDNGVVRVRSLRGEWLYLLRGAQAAAMDLVFAPNGEWLAASYANGSIYIWRMSDGDLMQVLTPQAEQATALAVSPDGSRLAGAADNGAIYLWTATEAGFSGTPNAVFSGHTGRVNDIDFSPNGELLVTAGEDGTIRLWKVPSGVPES